MQEEYDFLVQTKICEIGFDIAYTVMDIIQQVIETIQLIIHLGCNWSIPHIFNKIVKFLLLIVNQTFQFHLGIV